MQAQQFERRSPEQMARTTARQVRQRLAQPTLALQDRAAAKALEPTVRSLTRAIGGLFTAEVARGQALVGCLADSLDCVDEALGALRAADAVSKNFRSEVAMLERVHADLEPAPRVLRARIAQPPPLPGSPERPQTATVHDRPTAPAAALDLPTVPAVSLDQPPVPVITTTTGEDFEDRATTRPQTPITIPAEDVMSIPADAMPVMPAVPPALPSLPVVSTRSGLPRPVRRADANRRDASRHYLDVDIDFQSETNFYTGFAEDISSGGLFIATYNVQEVGSALTIAFSMPDGCDITVDGRVRWVREPLDHSSDMSPGMGVVFENLLPKDRAAIERFIISRQPLFYDE